MNAKEQEDNEDSLLKLVSELISLRKKSEYAEILIEGSIVPVYEDVENLIGYMRIFGDEKLLILCNYQGQETKNSLGRKLEENAGRELRETLSKRRKRIAASTI